MNDIFIILLCATSPIIFLGFLYFTYDFFRDIANWEEEKALTFEQKYFMNTLIPFCLGITMDSITFYIIYNWIINKPIRECNKKNEITKELDGLKLPVPFSVIKNSEWRKFNTNVNPISQELSNDIRLKYEKEPEKLKSSEQ